MMKKSILTTLTLATLLFAGCAAGNNQIEKITADEAKAIALEEAGFTTADVKRISAEMNDRDGVSYYDVDFEVDGKEYDYNVDALTGTVIADDLPDEVRAAAENKGADEVKPVETVSEEVRPADTKSEVTSEPANDSSKLTEAEAKAIALAQVPGAAESDIREFEVDYDDGRLEYDGKIIYDKMEYEFEIDGYSGAIRKWDVESIYD